MIPGLQKVFLSGGSPRPSDLMTQFAARLSLLGSEVDRKVGRCALGLGGGGNTVHLACEI